ncbi:MAG: ATP-binding protein, partial [Bacteroidota bacterium]
DRENDNFITFEFERDKSSSLIVLHFSELEDRIIIHAVDGFYSLITDPVVDPESVARKIEIRSSSPETSYYFNFSMAIADKLYFASHSSETNTSTIFSGEFSDFDGTAHIFVKELNTNKSIVNDAVYVESESSIYFATNEGVKPYSTIKDDFLKESYFKGKDIQNIIYTSDNRIYCSTMNPALHYIDLHTGNTGSYEGNPYRWGSLLNNTILSLHEGFSGNLWVGHQGQGISILNLQKKEFYTYRHIPYNDNSLVSNTVMCFEGNEKEIFVGCRVGGINILSKDAESGMNRFNRVKLYSEGSLVNFEEGIWDIEKVTEDYYLAGTLEGIYKILRENDEWKMYPLSVDPIFGLSTRKIYVDENNNVWVGIAGQGLLLIPDILKNKDLTYYQFTSEGENHETLSDNEIISMFVDSRSRFWIGTTNGLNLLTTPYNKINLTGNIPPDLKFKRFVATRPDPDFLNNNEINCIFENFDNTIWFGTQGGGINIYHPDADIFDHLTTEDGLPSNDVMGILRDETGVLWMSTKSDLVSYNQYADNPRFVRYGYNDGTQGNIYMVNSFYRNMKGDMFFGGDNGFTSFTPGDIKPNHIAPKLAITDLRVIDREIKVGDTISRNNTLAKNINYTDQVIFPFSMKVFSIGVAALHYQFPEGNYLAYMLEGFDNQWNYIPAEKRYLQFSNLPHGSYTLKIRAFSSDDVPVDNIKQLGLIITPPWYKEWYIVLLFVVIGLTIVLSFAWIAYNRQKLAYQKKLDDISIQTNESKMLFLTNIAHGLRTPLSLVIGPVEDMIQNYKDVDPKWRNHLNLIHRNSNYLLKLINQIIDFRRLHAGKLTLYRQNINIGKLVKEVGINFKGMEGRRKVMMQFEIPEEAIILSVDSQKIEEVLYNLLSNAFKHTPDGGSIVLSLKKEESELIISVFNEGSEIEENEKQRIFERFYKKNENIEGAGIGLSFSKSLVELHGGWIKVDSLSGKG